MFSFTSYHQRQIAMQLQYDGVIYSGFASQKDEETVEKHLFDALIKLKLINDRKVRELLFTFNVSDVPVSLLEFQLQPMWKN